MFAIFDYRECEYYVTVTLFRQSFCLKETIINVTPKPQNNNNLLVTTHKCVTSAGKRKLSSTLPCREAVSPLEVEIFNLISRW